MWISSQTWQTWGSLLARWISWSLSLDEGACARLPYPVSGRRWSCGSLPSTLEWLHGRQSMHQTSHQCLLITFTKKHNLIWSPHSLRNTTWSEGGGGGGPGNDVIMTSPVESPAFPSDRTPTGSWPEGVSPFNARTSSLSPLEVCWH